MKHKRPPKRLQDLNLMDRFLFSELIENAEAYKIILEIVLDKEINFKEEPIAENEKRKELLGKIARLDVCAIGDDDRIYNAEVQKENHAVKHHALKCCASDRGLTSGSYFAGLSLPICIKECVITVH